MTVEKTKAHAFPTKEFFVRMITRDISLEDCILDLIDNCVDGAWRTEGSRPSGLASEADLSNYKIEISASEQRFCIEDNCGGMTLDDAIEHAFSFGRRSDDQPENYSIGVYGIGMKRAVFKLGTAIKVRSTYLAKDGTKESFVVPINVDAWLANKAPAWDFDIESDQALSAPGVKIEIEGLTTGASTSFGSPAFLRNLRRTLARDYSIHINRGLKIVLNGEPVLGWKIELLQSAEFAPMRITYSDKVDEKDVAIEVVGGMSEPPPESNDPDEDDEGDKFFGWYVACNGRIVLAADRTTLSGWGTDGWPQWHPQYAGFIGIIVFAAADAGALPLTTTKRSVDVSSEVYRRARPKMREVTRKWIDYTNARKQALEEARKVEAAAQPVSIYDVQPAQAVKLPTFTATKKAEPTANISYAVPLQKFKELAKELGSVTMTRRELGLKTFSYTYDDYVGSE